MLVSRGGGDGGMGGGGGRMKGEGRVRVRGRGEKWQDRGEDRGVRVKDREGKGGGEKGVRGCRDWERRMAE